MSSRWCTPRGRPSPKSLLFTLVTIFSLFFIHQTEGYTTLADKSIIHLLSSSSYSSSSSSSSADDTKTSNQDPDFDPHTGALLSPILIPRVPGTPGSEKVQRHFIDFFSSELPNWTLEWQNSTSKTPATGDTDVVFSNLIFRRDPPWLSQGSTFTTTTNQKYDADGEKKFVKRLTLAAHYDSLYRPEGFIGAIDSAAPCAILMAVARNVDRALSQRWEGILKKREDDVDGLEDDADGDDEEEEGGVQIMFLDGEEAWISWTDTDSLYGSRALVAEWEGRKFTGDAVGKRSAGPKTELDAISLFVLLDLLGAPDPKINSFFKNTHWAYQHLAAAEAKLRNLGLLESTPQQPFLPEGKKAPQRFTGGYVLDDHVPFLQRGVPVLHVIPLPFPDVWHTMDDDGDHLDVPTVGDWAKIVSLFVAEWMDVEGFVPGKEERAKNGGWREKEEL
ncbi:hypothetical protein V8F06_001408 [Rhypophila decipiens]